VTYYYDQIKHMMAFIDQEANEKVEEIDSKVCVLSFFCLIIMVSVIITVFSKLSLTFIKSQVTMYAMCSLLHIMSTNPLMTLVLFDNCYIFMTANNIRNAKNDNTINRRVK